MLIPQHLLLYQAVCVLLRPNTHSVTAIVDYDVDAIFDFLFEATAHLAAGNVSNSTDGSAAVLHHTRPFWQSATKSSSDRYELSCMWAISLE